MLRGLRFFFAVGLIVFMAGCGSKQQAAEDMDSSSPMDMPADMAVEAQAPAKSEAQLGVEQQTAVAPAPIATETQIEPAAAPAVIKPSSKEIQTALKNAGFYQGSVDGKIGPKTKKALEAFQSANGLKADGKVGPKTWRVLSTYLVSNGTLAQAPTVDSIN